MQPASRRGHRRLVTAIGVVVAVLGVAAVGTYELVRINEPPWSDMRAAMHTFPVPPGYRVTEQGRKGTDCSYNPTCQGAPKVFEGIDAVSGHPAPDCNQLATMARSWRAYGYTDDQPIVGGICDRKGSIAGHPAYLRLLLGVGAGTRHPRDWVEVFITQ